MSAVALKTKRPPCAVGHRRSILALISSIERSGWDANVRHIAYHLAAGKLSETPTALLEWLLRFTGCSVLVWEMKSGRTQEDVLALLREAIR